MSPPQGSVEVGPPAVKGEGRARRSYASPDKLVSAPADGPNGPISCLADVLDVAIAKYGDQKGLGWRETIKMIDEEKEVKKTVGGKETTETKKWSYFELSDYKWWTYKQFGQVVAQAAAALIKTGHSKDTIFNIYSATSKHWQVMANACARQGITFATAYDSLGEEGLTHSINQPEAYGIFTNATLLATIDKVAKNTPSLKVIVYDGEAKDVASGVIDSIKSAREGIQIFHLEEFLQLGKDSPVSATKAAPEDTACIMYTSGSTGAPKGVQISNRNIIACIGAVQTLIPNIVCAGETYLAYLPLAHIMEFCVELCFMFVGAQVGYGMVKTLTDTSVRNCLGDLRTLKPSIMVGVPAVWELIRKGIVGKINSSGALKQNLFHGAVAAKRWAGRGSFIANLMDKIVFSAVAQGTGGNLKYALSGGAPISQSTQEFLSIALVLIIQGYGMTESTAMCALLPPEFHRYNAVGVPVPSAEIKLVDVSEAGYFSTNSPPQGEICIRGPSVTKGYFKNDKETKDTINDEGWLLTGDIGQWNSDGTLSVIDRKKNLVKLAGGEYIALERLESIYKSCSFVSNIAVHADSNANKPMAIIFPHEANLKGAFGDKDLSELCGDKSVREGVLKELNAVGKKAGLKPLEQLQTVILTSEEWTPANGLLTAAQKLQRKQIQTKFKSEVDAVYP